MKRLPTRHCDECEYSDWDFRPLAGSKTVSWFHKCAKGHKPRFYMPKGPLDYTAGYKRKCEDYKISNAAMRRIEADMWTSLQDAKERKGITK